MTDTTGPTYTNEPEYMAVVAECKAATAEMSNKQWILGDGACTVAKKYGENALEQFAKDINFEDPNFRVCSSPSSTHRGEGSYGHIQGVGS